MLVNTTKYFIKLIFSYLYKKRKLNLIKYNKKLQELADISLINYKFLSGKYIIFEKDGKAKEYSGKYDVILYEGGYLNGKRNGKEVQYNYQCSTEDEYKYEGEYLNGKRNGKGKEYYYDNQLLFEGEYSNGKRNGKGKEYNHEGKLIFEGEFLNGVRNGKGKEYYKNGNLLYEGEYLNGVRNGKGKDYHKNGKLLYIGDYLLDQRKGSEKLKQYKELDFLIFFHDSSKLGLHNSTIGLRSSESDWHFHESKNIDLKKLKGKGKELDQYCN